MKVLQINSVCGYGSTGRIAADLSRYLTQSGDDCLIAYGRGHAPSDVKSIRIGTDLAVNLHGVCSRITDKHGFYSKRVTQHFIQRAREYNPDVIHLHNLHGYYLHLPTLFAWLKECGKPVVWTLHDCWAFTGHCSHFDFVGCDRWKTGCHDCPQKREYPASYGFDNSSVNYKQKKRLFTSLEQLTLISPSEWLSGLVSESFLNRYPVEVIRNGIDPITFRPIESRKFRKQYGLQDKKIVLAVANVWTDRKGLPILRLLADRLDEDCQLVIVGVTSQQKTSLSKRAIGIEQTDSLEQLVRIYNEADVFVNPTLEETLGLVNMEAIACGTPVVTFDTGGCREVVSSSCGTVVSKNDIEELTYWVKRFLQRPIKIDRESWLRENTWAIQDEQYSKIRKLYLQVI